MNKLGILIKNYLLLAWGEIKYKKKKGGRTIGSLALIVVLGAFLIFVMGSSAAGQIYSYQPFGMAHIALAYSLMLALVVSLLMSIMRGSMGSNTADAELLLSLPVTRQTVIVAKSCSKYLFELWPMVVFFLPALVVYTVIMDSGIGLLLRGILLVLMIPLLSVGLSYILNWLFFKAGSKIKNPQNVTTALTMIFLVLYLVFVFTINSGAATMADISELEEQYYSFAPIAWGTEFMLTGSIVQLLLFACVTVLPFIIGVWLYASIFGRSHRTWHSTKTTIDYRSRTPYQALLKKEISRYFGSSAYFINTGFGMVMLLILTVVIIIGKNSFLAEILPFLGNLVPVIIILFACFCIATCYVSACSISLEGKNLWILKVAPVRTRDIFLAKLTTHLVVTLPVTLICSIVLVLVLGLPAGQAWPVILLPSAYCLLTGVMGLVINLKNPKMDWDGEDKVVKQSTAAILGMLCGMLPAAIVFIPYFVFLQGIVSWTAIYLIALAFFICAALIMWLWLRDRGEEIFEAL